MRRVAAIQMCSSDSVQSNLEIAGQLIGEASQEGAKLVVLPEMFAIMGKQSSDKVKVKETFGSGMIQDFLAACAKKNKVWIVGGTIPIACEQEDKIRAASLVYDDSGKVVARYDKIHLFDALISKKETYQEFDTTEPGDAAVVVNTPFGKLGLSVCYDIRFPGLYTHLNQLGAEIIVVPAAFTVKTGQAHWKLLMRARAVDTFSYMVGACQVGMHASGRKTYGHSLMVDPWGAVLSECNAEENHIVYADIDLAKIEQIRAAMPVHHHRRIQPDVSELKNSDSDDSAHVVIKSRL